MVVDELRHCHAPVEVVRYSDGKAPLRAKAACLPLHPQLLVLFQVGVLPCRLEPEDKVNILLSRQAMLQQRASANL